jgi:hypothetical protein
VVATGVTAGGEREILGLDVGYSKDEVFWRDFLSSLKQRGLSGVQLVIRDQHAGIVKAPEVARFGDGSPFSISAAQVSVLSMVVRFLRKVGRSAGDDGSGVVLPWCWGRVSRQLVDQFQASSCPCYFGAGALDHAVVGEYFECDDSFMLRGR